MIRLALVLTALICSGQEIDLDKQFDIFVDKALQAAKDLDAGPVTIKKVDRMFVAEGAQVSGFTRLDPLTREEVGKGIEISKSFLVNPPAVLEHVAVHEICHFKLDKEKAPNTEVDAERCVFEYNGADKFMEAYTIMYKQLELPMPTLERVKEALGIK